jgi:glutathione peroxidase
MKKFLGIILAILGLTASTLLADTTTLSVYSFKVKDINGKTVPLSQYKGKVLLIVNVASKCGHTPQYAGLQKLYGKYKDKGFVILGFPCNQFKEQEPGTDADIKAFCTAKYNVTFPLFHKIEVNGDHAGPLYQFLKTAEPDPDGNLDIGWNFTKFLIDRQGNPIKRIMTKVEPEDFDADIQAALSK